MISTMRQLLKWARHFTNLEEGQDAAEYALLIGFVMIVIIVAVGVLGLNLSALWNGIESSFAAAVP